MLIHMAVIIYYLVVVIALKNYLKETSESNIHNNNFNRTVCICLLINMLSLIFSFVSQVGLTWALIVGGSNIIIQIFLFLFFLGLNLTSLSHVFAFNSWQWDESSKS